MSNLDVSKVTRRLFAPVWNGISCADPELFWLRFHIYQPLEGLLFAALTIATTF